MAKVRPFSEFLHIDFIFKEDKIESKLHFTFPAKKIEDGTKYVSRFKPFCITDLDIGSKLAQDSQTFSFTLTDENRSQEVCSCLRVLDGRKNSASCLIFVSPKTEMITDSFYLKSIYEKFLKRINLRLSLSLGSVILFLKHLYATPLPKNSGESLSFFVPACPFGTFPSEEISTQRLDYQISQDDLDILIAVLDPRKIAILLFSLITEKKVLVSSSSLQIMTHCIHSLLTLLLPFTWSGILIEILPDSLFQVLSAPVPVIAGVHVSKLSILDNMQVDEIVFCNLDNGWIIYDEKEVDQFSQVKTLAKELKKFREDWNKTGYLDRDGIVSTVREFTAKHILGYEDYFVPPAPPGAPKKEIFDDAAFIEGQNSKYARPKHIRALLTLISETQMFSEFIAEAHEYWVRKEKSPKEKMIEAELEKMKIKYSKKKARDSKKLF